MRALKLILLTQALWLPFNAAYTQNLFINEFLASNSTVIANDVGEFDDWVEIYNVNPFPTDIGGMYLTDDLGNPTK